MEAALGRASVRPRRSVDWTAPFSIAMVVLLAVLVLLPLFWLLVTSFRDSAKAFTLEHYRHLFVDPAFVKPLVTTLWTSAVPPILSILVLTTSMPTPRPETLVIVSAVENPGRKISAMTS